MSSSSPPFASLTHRGQVHRLRTLALNALQQYPLELRRVRLLQHAYNTIFRVDTVDGQKYVIRINLPTARSLAQIQSEMAWLAALGRDTALKIPVPLANRAGDLVTTATAPEVPDPRHCAVFSWVPGKDLVHDMRPENFRQVGVLTAQLHTHAESFVPPPGFYLRKMDNVFPFDHGNFLEQDSDPSGLITPERRALFETVAARVEGVLATLYAYPIPPLVLHADLHAYNIRVHRGGLAALDFDDCSIGYPVQDIAITYYYVQSHPEYLALKDAYQAGYESLRPWPVTSPDPIPTLIAWRELDLLNYLLFSDNPENQEYFPKFLERAERRLRKYLES
ncbi:MAG: phosphotransferase [Anaerolineales bacterium]|nr:phosphotransferase [Anaerolineales bacterium]